MVGRDGVDCVVSGGEADDLLMCCEIVLVARVRGRFRVRRGGSGSGGLRCSAGSSLGMTASARSILVVGMVGQVLYTQSFRFLHERPFGSQRQLTPVVT